MDVLSNLSSSRGEGNAQANVRLGIHIGRRGDAAAVSDLVYLLQNGNLRQQHDAIKVLDEAGRLMPELLAPHIPVFLEMLHGKDNRLHWGSMAALQWAAKTQPHQVAEALPLLHRTAANCTVVTRDYYVYLLCTLYQTAAFRAQAASLFFEVLQDAPVNQVAMYAEKFLEVITPLHTKNFRQIIEGRLPGIGFSAKVLRLQKVLRKLP